MELRKYGLKRCYFYHYNRDFSGKTEVSVYVVETGVLNNSIFDVTEAYNRLII